MGGLKRRCASWASAFRFFGAPIGDAMKVLGVALLLLLVLVVGVFVYVGYNTNSIVKNAIETIGTQYLGAPVNVKEVEIALQEGRGTLKELEIGNPPGYAGAYAMRFGTVSVEIDPAQSTRELIVLKRITIDGARAAAIANTPQETNFRALSSNIADVERRFDGQADRRQTRYDEYAGDGLVSAAVACVRSERARR